MKHPSELATTEDVARWLRVEPDTVRRLASEGLIPRIKLSPKIVRYDPDAVVAALRHASIEGGKGADHDE
jgi:3-methyladenine DNA glycosylase AlkC